MLKTYLMIVLTFMSFGSLASEIEMPHLLDVGNAKAGSDLVATCAACHGAQGQSISSDWPNLAGQNQRYIAEQLKYYQQGERENILMLSVIPYLNTLSDGQLLDIAAFYSSQTPAVGQAKDDEELLALGQSLYRAGDLKRGIPACTACHSVNGAGNSQAGFPRVSGQQKAYLISTLKAYRNLERDGGDYSLVMQSVSQNLKNSDIEALANYMHGLYQQGK
jgi:cytochrome c553